MHSVLLNLRRLTFSHGILCVGFVSLVIAGTLSSGKHAAIAAPAEENTVEKTDEKTTEEKSVASTATVVKSPLSPEASLAHFQIADGLRMEIVAAEPEVVDPVSIAFDEQGALWVVEMRDYPNGPVDGGPPRSRIRRLTDQDGDGRYETATVFADHLLFATGVQPWQRGVIVTLAGEIAYFKDTDGDGRSDVKETWFRGFAEDNPQLRANHPRFGLDNRIYVANGLRNGTVVADPRKWGKSEPLPLNGRDFVFDPRTGVFSAVAGMGQFGLSFDDFGNRFVCSNRNPCKHIVLDDRHLARNPFLAVPDVANDVSPAGTESRVFPLSQAWTTSTLHAGQFTAACGVTIYRGDALPTEYRGNSFTCEPTGNLVHRDPLEIAGGTFRAIPTDEQKEFLASPDTWFRPVDLAYGPDGALYVVDMYRAVIEHPQWVPDELKDRKDTYDGQDRGRIYRILPTKSKPTAAESPLPADGTVAELVERLKSPNAWQRETASRLLYERQDPQAVAALTRALQDADALSAPTVVQLLGALDGSGGLTQAALKSALASPHAPVRAQALNLLEPHADWLRDETTAVLALASDPDPRVRFRVALLLGTLTFDATSKPAKVAAAVKIVAQDGGDPWTRKALLSSFGDDAPDFFAALLQQVQAEKADPIPAGIAETIQETAQIVGARRNPEEVAQALRKLVAQADVLTAAPRENSAFQQTFFAAFNGLGQGYARRGAKLTDVLTVAAKSDPAFGKKQQRFLIGIVNTAADAGLPAPLRTAALGVLRYVPFSLCGEPLLRMATEEPAQDLRILSVEVLGSHRDPRIGSVLLEDLRGQTPGVRRAIFQTLLRDPDRIALLLDDVAARRIAPAELDPSHARSLLNHGNAEIKRRAGELLGASAISEDRKGVLREYQAALEITGDPVRGRGVFARNCTVCHRVEGTGVDVGPDIGDTRTKTLAGLMLDILHPNQAIDNNFMSYTVVTVDGQTHSGIIAAETASSITLRQPENKTLLLLRQDIDELRSNGVSLMPEGLEKNITVPQMADLLSYLKNWRYLDGQVPLAEPVTKSASP